MKTTKERVGYIRVLNTIGHNILRIIWNKETGESEYFSINEWREADQNVNKHYILGKNITQEIETGAELNQADQAGVAAIRTKFERMPLVKLHFSSSFDWIVYSV